jgi:uncharacterized protein DUF6542
MTPTRSPGQKARTQAPPRRTSGGSVRLTGRGGAVVLFAACFLSLLLAAASGWAVLADVVFVMACGLVACFTRPAGLRSVVVCPPLAFCAGSVLAQLITAADTFSALAGVLVTLGTSTLWLFTGTALTMATALGRGWRPQAVLSMLASLRLALRDTRPRGDQWIERRLRRLVVQQDGADHSGGVLDVGRTADGQLPGRRRPGLAGEPAAVDGLLGVVRRAAAQDLEFLPAVRVGGHRDRQVRVPGQLDGQVTEAVALEPLGLLPDPGRCRAA